MKQTVYARFKSKEDLFGAVIRAVADDLVAPLSATDPGRSVRDRLAAIGEQYQRVILEPKRVRMARLMIAETASFPDLARRYFESGPSYVCDRLSAYLATATERGELKIENAPLAASQFLGLLKGVDHIGALLGIDSAEGEPQRKRRLAAAIDAFLKSYG